MEAIYLDTIYYCQASINHNYLPESVFPLFCDERGGPPRLQYAKIATSYLPVLPLSWPLLTI